jgi:hypothetical protein
MTSTTAGYAAAFDLYRDNGWAPLKLAAHTKYPPPAGFTGRDGVQPSYADMTAWATEEPDGNLAIRLPDDVIGVDVDGYGDKTGAATLAEAEKRWGRLPYSPRSTSRNGDHYSGIRLYRVPAGSELMDRIEFPELGIGDVEIIQHHHRYVMCWPSWHPGGTVYRWLGIDDTALDLPPHYPDDLPELPARWLAALTKPVGVPDLSGEPYDVRAALTDGQPSRRVAAKLADAILACHGSSRHDHTRDNVLALLRYGQQGEPGVGAALLTLRRAFVTAVGPDRPGRERQATEEFNKLVASDRAARLLAQPGHLDDGPAPGGEDGPADDDGNGDAGASTETAIRHRMTVLRVNREANRRLDDEERPEVILPPIKSLPALLAEPDTVTRYLLADVAPVDSRIILSAQYKAGKTTVVGNLIRSLVDGDPFLGRFPVNTTARVVLVDDELSENMLRRWLREQGIAATTGVADVVSLRGRVSTFDLLDDRCRQLWATRLADVGCEYLVLDCLRAVLDALGLDENRDAGRFLSAFDALLADAGITDTLLVHHMGHGNERARGDSRLQDWPDAIWRVVRENDDPASSRYFTAFGRDVAVPEGRLGYDPATRRLTYAPGSRTDAKTEAALRAVVELLAGERGEGLSGAAVERATAGDFPQRVVRAALKRGAESGLLSVSRGPSNATLHRITRPCGECGLPLMAGQESRHLSCPKPGEGDLI